MRAALQQTNLLAPRKAETLPGFELSCHQTFCTAARAFAATTLYSRSYTKLLPETQDASKDTWMATAGHSLRLHQQSTSFPFQSIVDGQYERLDVCW